VIGYVVGAKAGVEQFDEVVASARAVIESDEFASLKQSLRAHSGRPQRRQRGGAGAADDGAV
jgi:hypothetical protein